MDLSRITVFCFAASYVTALGLEAAALLRWKNHAVATAVAGGRRMALVGITIAGLFAHLAYLALRASEQTTPLSSPADWCLIAAAVLATIYLAVSVARARWALGLFLLPVVLGLVWLSTTASDEPFTPERASLFWGQAHGWLLVGAAASVCVGFVSGLVYLVQSWRLKRKLPPQAGFALPTLEWLERANARSLALSVWLMAGGFVSGLVLSTLRKGDAGGSLVTDPVVLSAGLMLGWLLLAEAFRWAYPPARTGRKVAYLTVAAFGFLAIMLVSVSLKGPGHGATAVVTPGATGAPGAAQPDQPGESG